MNRPTTQEQIDVQDARALVTGTLLAMLYEYSQRPDRPVRIDRVDMVDDPQGNHLPMVRLTMQSGTKLLLLVQEDL